MSALPTQFGFGTIEREFERLCRWLLDGPGVDREPEFVRLITGEAHPFGNLAVFRDTAQASDADRATAPLAALDVPSALIFQVPVSDDVERVLAQRGYALAESMPAMGVDIDTLAPVNLPEPYVFEASGAGMNDEWCDAFAAGYEIPRALAELFGPRALAHALARGGGVTEASCYAIRTEGRLVATSMVVFHDSMAGIYCVATIPEHRGKGLGAFATAQPLRIARERGERLGLLHASAMGEPVYRRIGFVECGRMPLYVRMLG